jgi:hypothetical protein
LQRNLDINHVIQNRPAKLGGYDVNESLKKPPIVRYLEPFAWFRSHKEGKFNRRTEGSAVDIQRPLTEPQRIHRFWVKKFARGGRSILVNENGE